MDKIVNGGLKLTGKAGVKIPGLLLICMAAGILMTASAQAADQVVVLIYHRFGEDDVPLTNIRLEQFEAQVAELRTGGYGLPEPTEVIEALRRNGDLPVRSVIITADDAYKSIQTEAWPRLKRAGIPLLVFVATDPVDQGTGRYMNWDDLRRLHDDGVTIGHHGAAHLHMLEAGVEESRADISRANQRFEEELGFIPRIFAYPYGEFDLQLKTMVKDMGFALAFAQYSGVAASANDPHALPRFPLNERFGDMERFRLIANARDLEGSDILPADSRLQSADNPPAFGFTLAPNGPSIGALACYPSHLEEPAALEVLAGGRVEVRFDQPFPQGRSRINCTMPGRDGRWYWLGRFFYVR